MKKILLVDDNDQMREAISLCLETKYCVITGKDGKEALSKWKTEKPDLILTDISMPEMDGLEFIQLVRKKDQTIPIIAISGQHFGDIALKAASLLGATIILHKPFALSKLIEVVEKILKY